MKYRVWLCFHVLGLHQIQVYVAVGFESHMLPRWGSPLKVDRSETGGCLIRSLETLISWTVQITNYNEEPHRAMADSLGTCAEASSQRRRSHSAVSCRQSRLLTNALVSHLILLSFWMNEILRKIKKSLDLRTLICWGCSSQQIRTHQSFQANCFVLVDVSKRVSAVLHQSA